MLTPPNAEPRRYLRPTDLVVRYTSPIAAITGYRRGNNFTRVFRGCTLSSYRLENSASPGRDDVLAPEFDNGAKHWCDIPQTVLSHTTAVFDWNQLAQYSWWPRQGRCASAAERQHMPSQAQSP